MRKLLQNLSKFLLALSILLPGSISAQTLDGSIYSSDYSGTLLKALRDDDVTNSTVTADGTVVQLTTDAFRRLRTAADVVDPTSGEQLSVIPISGATNLNGLGSVPVGLVRITGDTAETGSTTTVINATAHSARVGDVVIFQAGTAGNIQAWSPVSAVATNTITLSNALPATPANGDAFIIFRPVPIASSGATAGINGAALITDIRASYQGSAADGILKLEDALAGSGDAAVAILGVRRDSASAQAGDGDYTTLTLNRGGAAYCDLDIQYQSNAGGATGTSPIRLEDQAFGAAEAVIVSGGQSLSTIAQIVGTSGDLAPRAQDLGNRTVTINAPAGETFQACSDAETGTADNEIKAAVASNRMYITDISCDNTANVSSAIVFEDGETQIWRGGIPSSTLAGVGVYHKTFTTPLRGSVNTVFDYAMVTTGTSTTCCITGYISTI